MPVSCLQISKPQQLDSAEHSSRHLSAVFIQPLDPTVANYESGWTLRNQNYTDDKYQALH